mmetsp:Transcript_13272/g.28054  ORF Transcript_13272/g.28054 Transcript_13272/m.28054 type:complete len:229 (+) Transcript_13272:512-1198(+)
MFHTTFYCQTPRVVHPSVCPSIKQSIHSAYDTLITIKSRVNLKHLVLQSTQNIHHPDQTVLLPVDLYPIPGIIPKLHPIPHLHRTLAKLPRRSHPPLSHLHHPPLARLIIPHNRLRHHDPALSLRLPLTQLHQNVIPTGYDILQRHAHTAVIQEDVVVADHRNLFVVVCHVVPVEFSEEDGVRGNDGASYADSGVGVEFAGSGSDNFSFGGAFFGLIRQKNPPIGGIQ